MNNTVYQARLHWIIFAAPITLLCVSLVAGREISQLKEMAFFVGLFALIWIAMTWGTYYFSSLLITNKQVVLRTGMLVRKTVDIPLNKIESIDIRQSLPGSLLGFGLLVITGTGGTRHAINYLSRPLTCRRYIEQLMHQA